MVSLNPRMLNFLWALAFVSSSCFGNYQPIECLLKSLGRDPGKMGGGRAKILSKWLKAKQGLEQVKSSRMKKGWQYMNATSSPWLQSNMKMVGHLQCSTLWEPHPRVKPLLQIDSKTDARHDWISVSLSARWRQ